VEEWDARYRRRERAEDFSVQPTPLVVEWLRSMAPGRALDVACGTGRNSIWLAEAGWEVTAVDGSAAAIEILKARAAGLGVRVDARVADLGAGQFEIERASYDAILDCYYLQRDLFPAIRDGVRPGGVAICIVHLANQGEAATYKHAVAGELAGFFQDWEILHYREGPPDDPAHRRAAAEIVARRP